MMSSSSVSPSSIDIVKPSVDDRSYEYFTLPNALPVIVVSDPKCEKAAASMDVHAGHFSDPEDIPGLAHFLEHMLFLGTKKYPVEDSYQKYLTEHGGSCNAFTSSENTNYYFQVLPGFLETALDMFSSFFVSPLFTEDATMRELNAVHSENSKNLQADVWRLSQLNKHLSNPKHPYHKFGTGNLATLNDIPSSKGIKVREALLKFYEQHYSANNMRLAVLGREPVEVLKQWVVDKFSEITNKGIPIPSFGGEIPFEPSRLPLLVHTIPVKETRQARLLFPLPEQRSLWRSKPTSYLSHLIGHEGTGSLFAALRKKGLANALSAGGGQGGTDYDSFAITIDLTEDGLKRVEEVVSYAFQYISMLRKEGPQKWVHDECAMVAESQFRFKDKSEGMNFACNLASDLQVYPAQYALSGATMFFEYSPEAINAVLEKLVPSNLMLVVVGKQFEGQTDSEEPWYLTQYKAQPIPAHLVQEWSSPSIPIDPLIKMCDPNPFIPSNLEVKQRPTQEDQLSPFPRAILRTETIELWHRQDTTFNLPKAAMNIQLFNADAHSSPRNAAYSKMFRALWVDSLNELAYHAEVAGLRYSIETMADGYKISVSGFDDKLFVLARMILEHAASRNFSEERFLILREKAHREYVNLEKESAIRHAQIHTTNLLYTPRWHYSQMAQVITDVTLDEVMAFGRSFLSRLKCVALIQGNVLESEALAFAETMQSTLQPKPLLLGQMPLQRITEVPKGSAGSVFEADEDNPQNNNSAIEFHLQVGLENTKEAVLLDLLTQVCSSPAFTELRTVQQIGYVVACYARHDEGVQGFSVFLQSAVLHPLIMDERVETWFLKFQGELEAMPDQDIKENIQSLIEKRKQRDTRLGQEFSRNWDEIYSRQYKFNRREEEAKAFEEISKEDLLWFWRTYIARSAPSRRKLSVWVAAEVHKKQADEIRAQEDITAVSATALPKFFKDHASFKTTCPLYAGNHLY